MEEIGSSTIIDNCIYLSLSVTPRFIRCTNAGTAPSNYGFDVFNLP